MAKEKKRGPGRPKGSKNKKKKESISPEEKQKIEELQDERDRKAGVRDIIWGIVYIAIGVLIFVAVQFHQAGTIGNTVGDVLKGLFGLLGLVLPWYLIFIGVLLITHVALHHSVRTVLASLIVLIFLCLINAGRYIDPQNIFFSLGRFYSDGVALEGGGVFGMSIGSVLVKMIGIPGLYIFAFAGLAISLLLLLNSPVSKWLAARKRRREETLYMREAEERLAEEERHKEEAEPEEEEVQEEIPFITDEEEEEPQNKKRSFLKKLFGFDEEEEDEEDDEDDILDRDAVPDEPEEPSDGVRIELPEDEAAGSDENVFDFIKEVNPFDKERKPDPNDTREIDPEDLAAGSYDEQEGAPDKVRVTNKDLKETATAINKGLKHKKIAYKKPKLYLLSKPSRVSNKGANEELRQKAKILDETLKNFGVDARVVQVTQGPAVTRYEVQPNVGVKVSKIVSLADDIALNLQAKSIRMEAPIPGKAAVGIEVENTRVNTVTLREIIDSEAFKKEKSRISFAVGKDIAGNPIVGNLKEMPHLLIAGATGSGKSVCINSIITSILYKSSPDEVKFVLIDPKVVELGNFNGIPHLLIPVVTDPSKAAAALSWAVVEMTNRYKAFSVANAKNLSSYNSKMKAQGNEEAVMPQVVIIIDELADLMIVARNQVQETIQRIAQLGRAAGIHMIVATQRPSVDIITGVIKANIPARIAFAVSSGYDSKTILDTMGAEKLVGKGDMLYSPKGGEKPIRVQGTFVSEQEVNDVIDFVKAQAEETDYSQEVMEHIESGGEQELMDDDADDLLPDAIECVVEAEQASVSMLQRHFRIGYNRAARIVDEMEDRGIVGPADGARPRKVLMTMDEFQKMKEGASTGDGDGEY